MITIIAATNRVGSNTLKVAKEYQALMAEMGSEAELFSLQDFHSMTRDEAFLAQEACYLIPAEKFVFVMPEYNGSFPGIFKLLMDISDVQRCWNHKKVMLVGLANGRAGNLRGLDHMTNMAHYMKMNVFHTKIPISLISRELQDDRFVNEHTLDAVKGQIRGFLSY